MKYRPAATYYIIEGKEYTMGERAYGDFPFFHYHFHSTAPDSYPDIIFRPADLTLAYRTTVLTRISGEKVFLRSISGNSVRVRIPPGSPAIELLNAKQIPEGGWYETVVAKKDLGEVWEQRYATDVYKLPDGLEGRISVEL